MKDLKFTLSTDEVNIILESLGHMPFAKVYGLIEKLQMQAQEQLQPNAQPAVKMPAAETAEEMA